MKRIVAVLLALLMPFAALAETVDYTYTGKEIRSYDSNTLRVSIEQFELEGARCYLTKLWMADPGKQIRKAIAPWKQELYFPSDMAKKIEDAVVVINGSGYVSPVFPWIPDDYPGDNADYFYTPLGSLTIVNGEVLRNLEGVPYYGLTLEADGLHLYVGEDNETVLAASPTQTWSFYTGCPLIQEGESILDRTWSFAKAKAIRTVIAKLDEHQYIILTVTAKLSAGWSLITCTDFLLANFHPEWAYDLDGGPSSALLFRRKDSHTLRTIYGNNSKDADIMAFVE